MVEKSNFSSRNKNIFKCQAIHIAMKRGLIALFVVSVLMLNIVGVSALMQETTNDPDAFSVKSSTTTVKGAPIMVPETKPVEPADTGALGKDITFANSKDTIPKQIGGFFLSINAFMRNKFNPMNSGSAVTSTRGEENTQIAMTATMPLISLLYS